MINSIPAENLKKTISYLYLLFFCPPAQLNEFNQVTAPMRKELAENTGLQEEDFFAQALPQACHRIVAFQQATREPEQDLVVALLKTASSAHKTS